MNKPFLLYVEDDEIEVMKFQMALKKQNIDVDIEVAYNGKEGLEFLHKNKHHPPKIVILDINMPKVNGLEMLEQLKNSDEFSSIPVIMLTSSNNQKDVMESYKNQAAGYFVKPFKHNDYLNIIKVIEQYWSNSLLSE